MAIEQIIKTAWQARLEKDFERAEQLLLQAIEQSQSDDLRTQRIRGLNALAHVLCDQGDHQRARVLNEQAVSLCREQGNPLLLAHALRHLGDVLRALELADKAGECYREALSLYREVSDRPSLDYANALRASALLEQESGHADQARTLWSEALELYRQVGIEEGVSECQQRLAAGA